MKQTIYNKRYLTKIVVEAATPLAVGTGKKDVLTDALVARDWNGLPYIPGSSIAGVLRHSIGDNNSKNSIFGFQEGDKGHGSCIIFTDAVLIDENGEAQDGLMISEKSDFLSHYDALPIRQHVSINDKGSTNAGGKFDEQVVYQGSRFVFEMEMVDNGDNESRFLEVLDNIYSQHFRLGGGTRCGFGAMKVIDVQYRSLDMREPADLELYISKSSSLKQTWEGYQPYTPNCKEEKTWHEYVLELKPLDFFLFSSGFSDDEADITPVTEARVTWDNGNNGRFEDEHILISATSVKGAIAHRVAYHWNKNKGHFIDEVNENMGEGKVGNENDAVKALFGHVGKNNKDISRGNVLLSDVMIEMTDNKLFNHVTIDRITGGTIDGHLFTEKVINGRDVKDFTLTLLVNEKVFQREDGPDIKNALEQSLEDICVGLLPLGGGTNRGHGIFTGSIIKGKDDNGNQ